MIRPLPTYLSLASFALLSIFMLSGCPDKKAKYPTCGSDKDCKDGQHCFKKHCSQCSEDSHCEHYQSCQEGACQLKSGMCNSKEDCISGQICKNNTCSACQNDSQCRPGEQCFEGGCLTRGSCNKDEDCKDDEDCIDKTCQKFGPGGGGIEVSCQLESVYFQLNDFAISEEKRPTLQKNSECILQAGDRNVFVEGHTDNLGTDEYNIALSEKRSRSVANFMTRLGIDPKRLRIVPKGESEASAENQEERSQERRVDFQW